MEITQGVRQTKGLGHGQPEIHFQVGHQNENHRNHRRSQAKDAAEGHTTEGFVGGRGCQRSEGTNRLQSWIQGVIANDRQMLDANAEEQTQKRMGEIR